MEFTEGFINIGLHAAQREVEEDLLQGGLLDKDYYRTIAADAIWEALVKWKNLDSCTRDVALSIRDVAYGCRRHGIPFDMDGDDITIRLPEGNFHFTYICGLLYGGPANSEGHYKGYDLYTEAPYVTIKTFMKLVQQFWPAMTPVMETVDRVVDDRCRSFREERIMAMTVREYIEPGMEDIPFRYRCRIEDGREKVDVWLYPERGTSDRNERIVKFSFDYGEMVREHDMLRKVISLVSEDTSRYEYYPQWARLVSRYSEDTPPYSETKML